ncbi:low molecular weight phosphotyrosine protein phosphatase [Microbulbifer sp. OS29]|uniref:protein-tyrosine-phosphatase n=1 Tax=Microbulbifer okhotskensis TaxID=2926617 RepID=A0A9X2EL42_9GAMM|nr:low molecular weight protein-tyrosine-phosphatase [Microbulbifer okhotskensis]MCO1334232.1 low molecular weight phosphotyrosine protein phosphatase [Microbulbifer okhotskensis]
MTTKSDYSVLFVCLGNICRSPLAEAVFHSKARQAGLSVSVDSAGIINYHAGKRPDPRTLEVGQSNGYSFENSYARQVEATDFTRFDHIFAMDKNNLEALKALQPKGSHAQLQLFLPLIQDCHKTEVPDPYYGGVQGFRQILQLIEQASDALVELIKRTSSVK